MAAICNKFYLFILLSCIFALSLCEATSRASHDVHQLTMLTKHEQWMAKHGRSYASLEEKDKRFRIFKDNVEFIERFNKAGNRTYKVGVNKFADLTNEEFLAKYTGHKPSLEASVAPTSTFENNAGQVPESLDWRDRGAVTPVKNQGQCGCCWAFSAVAAIESIVQLKSGTLQSLSEQQILDCYSDDDPCNGGSMTYAFDFVTQSGGLASDADYPYQMQKQTCSSNNVSSSLAMPITGYERVSSNNEQAMLMAVAKQPLSVAINGGPLQLYNGGVLTGECGTEINHAVVVVGYGTDEHGTKYWLFKNSWGEDWGENGYGRVQRDVDHEEGMCGIATDVTYPTASIMS